MMPLSPEALELLDFLCAANVAHCRVKTLKTFAGLCRAKNLREAGLIEWGGYKPTPEGFHEWAVRTLEAKGFLQPRAETQPQPTAVIAEGDGNARLAAPSPDTLESLARHFRPRWERLGVIAKRAGCQSGVQFRGTAIRLRDFGLVEMVFQVGQSLWRLSPDPRAPKVDLKVNAGRDWSKPPPGYVSRPESVIKIAKATNNPTRSRIKREAQKRIDEGLGYGAPGSVREAQVALEREQAEAARLSDPIEQAKTTIRRAGPACFSATTSGGPEGHYYIGSKLVTEAELLAHAEQLRERKRA